jgi:hypothetical protein
MWEVRGGEGEVSNKGTSIVWDIYITSSMGSHIVVKGGMLGGTRVDLWSHVHILINPIPKV